MNVLEGTSISKRYGNRAVLRDLDVHITSGEVVGITGDNGSGKSTLVKILCGLLRPDSGNVSIAVNKSTNRQLEKEKTSTLQQANDHTHTTTLQLTNNHATTLPHYGLVAPYLNIYDEFTPRELLVLQRKLHGESADATHIEETLQRCGLGERMDETVRTLSSGLRQRVVIALAVHRAPTFLMFDEPTVTLDAAGIEIVKREIRRQQDRGGIVVVATNDESEKLLCTRLIQLSTTAKAHA